MDEPMQVVSIAAMNDWGYPLFGLRRDSKKWTLPGGKINRGEDVTKAAIRELWEETGLKPRELTYLGKETIRIGHRLITVHAFRAKVSGTPTIVNDPDRECSEWKFVRTPFGELPPEIANSLHSPIDVTLDFLGYQNWRGRDAWRRQDHHFWAPEPEGDAEDVDIDPDIVMDEALSRHRRTPNGE